MSRKRRGLEDIQAEIEEIKPGVIKIGDYVFDAAEGVPTREDVIVFAAAAEYFEQHPEVVPS